MFELINIVKFPLKLNLALSHEPCVLIIGLKYKKLGINSTKLWKKLNLMISLIPWSIIIRMRKIINNSLFLIPSEYLLWMQYIINPTKAKRNNKERFKHISYKDLILPVNNSNKK